MLPGSVTLRLTRVQAERKAAFRVVFAQAAIALLIVAFGAEGAVPVALLAGYGATFVGYWAAPRLPLSRR